MDSYYLDSRVKVSNAGEFYTCNMQGRSEVYIQEDGEFEDHLKDSEMTRVMDLLERTFSEELGMFVIRVPVRMEVCSMCHGSGTVVNPSIDAGGLRDEDFRGDPDFARDYFYGAYDVKCPHCNGLRVEGIPVWDDNNPLHQAIKDFERRQWEEDRQTRRELAYGY